MSETNSKGVPLAAVVYVVRFDAKGQPLTVASICMEHSGATRLEGGAAQALEPLLAATRCSMKETVGLTMLEAFNEHEGRDLAGPAAAWAEPPTPETLPAAGEIF